MNKITHKISGSRTGRTGNRWSKNYFNQNYDNVLVLKFNGKVVFYAELKLDEYGVSISYSENFGTTQFIIKQLLKRKLYLESLVGDKLHLDWYLDETSNECYNNKSYYYRKRIGICSRCFGFKRIVGRDKYLTRRRGWKVI